MEAGLAEAHAAHRDPTHLEPGSTQSYVVHLRLDPFSIRSHPRRQAPSAAIEASSRWHWPPTATMMWAPQPRWALAVGAATAPPTKTLRLHNVQRALAALRTNPQVTFGPTVPYMETG